MEFQFCSISLTLCCLQGSRFFKRKWNKYDQILIYFCSKYCSLDLLLRKSCILKCVCLFYFFTLVAIQLHQKKNCQQKFVAHCMLPTNIRDKIMTEVFNVCHGKLALTKGSQCTQLFKADCYKIIISITLLYHVGSLGNLQTLKVDENHLAELPASIGR